MPLTWTIAGRRRWTIVFTQSIRQMDEKSPYFMKRSGEALSSRRKVNAEKRKPIKVKYEDEANSENSCHNDTKKKRENEENSCDQWFPSNWKVMIENIKVMRKDKTAVVDSQGCERTADKNASPQVKRFQTLISLMLSSQTKDQITYVAMQKLIKHGLTPEDVIATSEETVGQLIHPVGFWKRKAKYIKEVAEICKHRYNNDIPETIDGLTSLPGVGPKMAYICLNAAWGKVEGIGVDTHVHRIANRLNWVKKKTKTPEETRKALESWLPKEEWKDINILLVGFGQQLCLPVGPKCEVCLNNTICPASTITNQIKN